MTKQFDASDECMFSESRPCVELTSRNSIKAQGGKNNDKLAR